MIFIFYVRLFIIEPLMKYYFAEKSNKLTYIERYMNLS